MGVATSRHVKRVSEVDRTLKLGVDLDLRSSRERIWTFIAGIRVALILTLLSYVIASECTAQRPIQTAGGADSLRLLDDHEGVVPTWTIRESDSLAAVVTHTRSDKFPHQGRRSEYASVWGTRGGEQILLTHDTPYYAAIDELRLGVWIRGRRSGFQFMARVRLPRSMDKDGQPMRVWIYGDRYNAVGFWQSLNVDGFQDKLADSVRALRIQHRKHIDAKQAYIDQVAINAFGGAGRNQVYVDDLYVEGAVQVQPQRPKAKVTHLANVPSHKVAPTADSSFVNWMPKVVTHHGESFAALKKLGFNTVWLNATATRAQMDEAERADMWLVCPPPEPIHLITQYRRVFGWLVDASVTAPADGRQHSALIKANYPRACRTIAIVQNDVAAWSRAVDIVVTKQPERVPANVSNAWTILGNPLVDSSRWLQLRMQAWQGISRGYQGFLVHTANDVTRPAARHLKNILELLNLELTTLQPWIVKSESIRYTALSSDARFRYTMLRVPHSDLVFVQWADSDFSANGYGSELEIPTTANRDVFRVEPGGLSAPLPHRRVPGGVRITLNPHKPDGILLLTDRGTIVRSLSQHLHRVGPRHTELLVDVLRTELVELDRRMQHSVTDPTFRSHLRQEVHQLHGRIAPVLEGDRPRTVRYRDLDHVLGQLERVHKSIDVF